MGGREMFEDGKAFVERRLSPRIKMTVRRHIAYWVAMSPARRVVASVLVAAAIGGTTFAACRASDVTGPNFKQQQAGISRNLVGDATGSLVGTSDHDSDSDMWPMAPSSHNKISDDEANNDERFRTSIETVFPVTEAVFNTCVAEGPIVLNGYIKERIRTESDPNDGLKFKLTSFKDTRGVFGTITYWEDYYDDNDRTWKKREHVVRYRNRESLLDKFEAGPIGMPFQSVFEAKMFLQRDGHADGHHHHDNRRDGGHRGDDDHHDSGGSYRWQPGDDLFVFVKQVTKVGRNGEIRTQNEFRSECK
jgi:hypothetical protein